MTPEGTTDVVRAFVALMVAASVIVLVSRRVGLPDELGLLLVGLAASPLLAGAITVTPDLVLLVLLPGLVFEAAYRLQIEELRRLGWAVALLAVPGVLVTAAAVALVLRAVTGMDLGLAFLVGAMVSPTDPATMIATFARLRVPRGLSTLVQAEALFNDGTGIVLFSAAVGMLVGNVSIGMAIGEMFLAIVGSTIIGLLFGLAASRLVGSHDFVLEVTLTIAVAYGSYLVADELGLSGIIATVVAGITLGNYASRQRMSERTREAVDVFWSVIAFVLTALVFLLIGITIRVGDLVAVLPAIAAGAVALVIGRAVAVYALAPLGRVVGAAGAAQIPLPWMHIAFWAGLRGAVAVALALSLPIGLADRLTLQEIGFGIVLVTILVFGSTSPLAVRLALRRGSASRP